jgi:hypothetical protein
VKRANSSAAAYSPAPQEGPRGDIAGTSVEDSPQESPSAGDMETGQKYFPGDVPGGFPWGVPLVLPWGGIRPLGCSL